MGASFKGFIDVVEILIKNKANVDVQNTMGATALIYSAMFNKKEIFNFLIQNGADATIKDNKGDTAISLAKRNGMIK